jgi:hypothetical protein
MNNIEQKNLIVLKSNTVKRSNSGTISGVIYFDFGDYQFPEIEWNDFVVVILGWWLEAAIRLSKGLTSNEDLKFMDGPLQVRITNKDNMFCTIECIDSGRDSAVEYSKVVSIDELLSGVRHAGNLLLDICKDNNWHSDDINLLSKLIKT